MDRLIIEAALEDVNEISLQKNNDADAVLALGFKAGNMDRVSHAFSALKKISGQHGLSLIVCKTMTAGIYDLELKTEGLDEPVRIMNKAITNETLGAIEDEINRNSVLKIGVNVDPEENWIPVNPVQIKDCEVKL